MTYQFILEGDMLKFLVILSFFSLNSFAHSGRSNASSFKTEKNNICKYSSRSASYQGCCSHHKGIKKCPGERQRLFDSENRVQCNDGTPSPTCVWKP